MSRSNSLSSSNSSKYSSKLLSTSQQGSEILQRILNADCDPRDLELRQLRKAFVELLELHRKLQASANEIEQEKLELVYQVDLLKDELFDNEEQIAELQRLRREQTRAKDAAKRAAKDAEEQLKRTEELLSHRDQLLQEAGLVLYVDPTMVRQDADKIKSVIPQCLLSKRTHDLLDLKGDGTLDEKIQKVIEKNINLEETVAHLTEKIERYKLQETSKINENDERMSVEDDNASQKSSCSPRELSELRSKVERQSDEIACLKLEKSRLENALARSKDFIAELEKGEEELNEEKRKLKRERRNLSLDGEQPPNRNEPSKHSAPKMSGVIVRSKGPDWYRARSTGKDRWSQVKEEGTTSGS